MNLSPRSRKHKKAEAKSLSEIRLVTSLAAKAAVKSE